MQNKKRNIISKFISAAWIAVLMAAVMSSCNSVIYEDLEPCPHGVKLRFVYDYNMEFANAFPSSVDCLTLLIYDEDNRYVTTRVVTGAELQDEAYRMQLDLEEGTYRFVAYGGMACPQSSFSMLQTPAAGTVYTDLRVEMDDACLTMPVGTRLHNMFWGELLLSTADLYQEGVVKMMKNTNNIRIVLQQVSGLPVDNKDFTFEVVDDNTLFSYNNDLIPNGTIHYAPWSQGQVSTGLLPGGGELKVAYAEFSTSRLMVKNSPQLIIKHKPDGKEVVNIPLNNYLLLLKSDVFASILPQEFLDRESNWSMIFFLDANLQWGYVDIKVKDWTVRINRVLLDH